MKFTKITLSIIAVIICSSAFTAKAQQANFSAKWTRDSLKSDPGTLSFNSIPTGIIVKQKGARVEVTRTSRNKNGEVRTYTEQLLPGELKMSVVKPGMKKQANIQWAPDQKGFTESASYLDDSGNLVQTSKETWSLNDDATLQVKLTITVNGKDYLLTETFDKQ